MLPGLETVNKYLLIKENFHHGVTNANDIVGVTKETV